MILWPLTKEYLQRIEDALASKFGITHKIKLICDANAGYIAYSETIKNYGTSTTINVSEPVILSMIVEQYLVFFTNNFQSNLKQTV